MTRQHSWALAGAASTRSTTTWGLAPLPTMRGIRQHLGGPLVQALARGRLQQPSRRRGAACGKLLASPVPRNMSTAMAATLDFLQAQVLSLSKADRSRLLERLIASLDVDVAAEEEWEQLAEARDVELDSGAVAPVALEDAMARLRAKFPG